MSLHRAADSESATAFVCQPQVRQQRASLVRHEAARHVTDDLARLLHGEVDLVQVVDHLQASSARSLATTKPVSGLHHCFVCPTFSSCRVWPCSVSAV